MRSFSRFSKSFFKSQHFTTMTSLREVGYPKKSSLKLFERFLKNFENNTGRGNPKPLGIFIFKNYARIFFCITKNFRQIIFSVYMKKKGAIYIINKNRGVKKKPLFLGYFRIYSTFYDDDKKSSKRQVKFLLFFFLLQCFSKSIIIIILI